MIDTKNQYITAIKSAYTNNDAEIIGKRFETLDYISVDTVLNDAKDLTSSLHRYFEWDDKIASNKFRRRQANAMITAIKVRIINDETTELKAYHPIIIMQEGKKGKEFMPVIQILNDKEYINQLIAEADTELKSWFKKWSEYGKINSMFQVRYHDIFEEIEKII